MISINKFIFYSSSIFILIYIFYMINDFSLKKYNLPLDLELPQTTYKSIEELFSIKIDADYSMLFYADIYKRRKDERLIIIRPINWYVYSIDNKFYFLTYVAGNKCLPDQCSTINLQAIKNWKGKKSKFIHGCLNISLIQLLNIFAPCNFYVRHHRVSLEKFLNSTEGDEKHKVTIVEFLNFLISQEKI